LARNLASPYLGREPNVKTTFESIKELGSVLKGKKKQNKMMNNPKMDIHGCQGIMSLYKLHTH